MRAKAVIGTVAIVGAVVVVMLLAFRREYVVSGDGLVDLAVRRSDSTLIVKGALISSSAKITKTTVTFHRGTAHVRVYAGEIGLHDRPEDCRGTFAIAIPSAGVKTIAVGESPRWLTIGSVFGVPVRLPRVRGAASSYRVVWTDSGSAR